MINQMTRFEPSWRLGKPVSTCTIRQIPEDFRVFEDLGYEPEGEGEHHYLYIQKRGENTDWVARQLANFCQVSPRDVAYAGKKDRHALTEQWFSVHLPGHRRTLNWALFGGDSIKVLKYSKHRRKIKLGNLRGNRFDICLRGLTEPDQLLSRISAVTKGVPNYFGEQRFGRQGGNLLKGQAMLLGEFEERQRHKRGLYISAVRSQLFNEIIHARLQKTEFGKLILGDTLIEPRTQRCERWMPEDEAQQPRIEKGELVPSAPLWGKGDLYSSDETLELEQRVAAQYPEICNALAGLGLRQERRAAVLVPENLALKEGADGELRIAFSLPAGSFATSVLRELCSWESKQEQSEED